MHRLSPIQGHPRPTWADSRLRELETWAQWCGGIDTGAGRARMRRMGHGRKPELADRMAAEHAAGKRVLAGVHALPMVGSLARPTLLAAKRLEVERRLRRP